MRLYLSPPQKIMRLEAVEYFLLCLVRFPTAYSLTVPLTDDVELLNWVKGNPHLVLLKKYLEDAFTSSTSTSQALGGLSAPTTPGGSFNAFMLAQKDATRKRLRDLFLFLMIDYWMELPVLHFNHHMASTYRKAINSTVAGGSLCKPFLSSL
jgi:hypothetical protein